jgi:cytochrome b561
MELCWLCAWANFLAVSTTQIRFPLAPSCAAFFMAFFSTRFFMTKSYRLIWVILGHMSGLGLMIWAALFAGTGWRVPVTLYHWYEMSLIAAMVCLFWYKGAKLLHRQMSYPSICNHFDLGISLLFALLIIKLLLQIKAGIQVPESFTLYSIGGYFLFGLAAIFFSHTPTTRDRHYLQGFRVYGGLISGAIVLLLCTMAIAFVLLPFMTSFAESGYSVMKQTAGPLSPYLIAILRFIFSPRTSSVGNGNPQQHQPLPSPDTPIAPGHMGWIDFFAYYSILLIVILLGVVMIGFMAYMIFKFLMSKHPAAVVNKKETKLFFRLIHWLVAVFNSFRLAILALTETVEDAKKGFTRLVSWGRKSGMPRLINETPAEYAARLGQQFIPLEDEINTIVHAFHLETYGEMSLEKARIHEVIAALKTIHRPCFWPLRIKSFWKMETRA